MGSLLPAAIDRGLSSHHSDWTLLSDDALNIALLHLFTTKQMFSLRLALMGRYGGCQSRAGQPGWGVFLFPDRRRKELKARCAFVSMVVLWRTSVVCFLVFSVWGFASLLKAVAHFSCCWCSWTGFLDLRPVWGWVRGGECELSISCRSSHVLSIQNNVRTKGNTLCKISHLLSADTEIYKSNINDSKSKINRITNSLLY